MRIEATDVDRVLPVAQCTSGGAWCRQRWLEPGALCARDAKSPRAVSWDGACPELYSTTASVRALVAHCAQYDVDDTAHTAVVDGVVWTVRGLYAAWQRPHPRVVADALDCAGEAGRCACGWVCATCNGTQHGACRAFNGRCCLAEDHVVRCAGRAVQWATLPRAVQQGLPPARSTQRPDVRVAARAPTRRARRRLVRMWARRTTRAQRNAPPQ